MHVLKRYALAALALMLVLFVAGACDFSPDLGDGAVACGPGGACPPGYACAIDGRCYQPGSGPGLIGTDAGEIVPALTLTDITVQEGSDGTTDATFTVRVVPPIDKPITVDYTTVDDSAIAGKDYTFATGTLTIPANAASAPVTVKVIADKLVEQPEKFFLELKNPQNAVLGEPHRASCTINDDDSPGIAVDDVTVVEGNTGLTDAVVKVYLTTTFVEAVTVNVETTKGTAIEEEDYIPTSDTLTFAAGEMEKTIIVPIKGDLRHESDKNFNVVLSNVLGAPVIDAQAVVTIKDDDPIPSITIADAQVTEDNTGTATMTFNVTLSAPSAETVKVDFATGGGTANATDYAGTTGTLTFDPDTTEQTISVQVNGDTVDEPDETFNVTLTAPVGATLAKSSAVGTIIDDDADAVVTVDDIAITEGDAGTKAFAFSVKLATASGKAVTVNYATADGTAVAPGDYTATSGTVTFAAGETQKTVNVTVNGDVADEGPEKFFLNLTIPANGNATLERPQITATILNDDSIDPSVTIDDVTVTEGGVGSTVAAAFKVKLSNMTSNTVVVTYATANGTATSGSDYIAASSTVTFNANELEKTINVTVNGDALYEGNETFFVNLTAATNASIIDAQGIGTITNDDPQPTVSIGNVNQVEGNSGNLPFQFPVTLSGPSGSEIKVNYATASGTAISGSDFSSASGILTFAPGETAKTINVNVSGDNTWEPNESFTVTLSNASNTTIANGVGTGTIENDDPLPTIKIDDVKKQEGNGGTTTFTFTVTRTGASSQNVTVDFATADGTATSADYTAKSGTLTFVPGDNSEQISITVTTDNVVEPDETFFVNLTNCGGCTIIDNQGLGTIQNDDQPLPTLSINDRVIGEGSNGTVQVTFTVTLTPSSNQTVTVQYATADGTAKAGSDYTAKSGSLSFSSGATTRTFTVDVLHDTLNEDNETFLVNLSNPSANATILDGQGQATITDNDPVPTLSVADVSVTEADSDKTVTFNIVLSKASGRQVTVAYATAEGSAKAGGSRDYLTNNGTATFAPGETTKPVVVTIKGDNNKEGTEDFFLNLSNAVNATISDNQAKCTISDDD